MTEFEILENVREAAYYFLFLRTFDPQNDHLTVAEVRDKLNVEWLNLLRDTARRGPKPPLDNKLVVARELLQKAKLLFACGQDSIRQAGVKSYPAQKMIESRAADIMKEIDTFLEPPQSVTSPKEG